MNRSLLLLLVVPLLAGCPIPDSYPGDGPFTRRVQDLLTTVRRNSMDFPWAGNRRGVTRRQLCQELARRHFQGRIGNPPMSNADWLACPDLTEAALALACERAMAQPDGYDGAEGWNAWRGRHLGTWYDDGGKTFADEAVWSTPRKETSKVPGDHDANGNPREYDFQPVQWPDRRVGRHGWNQSHPDVPYLWGWDPKENGNENGDIGTHLGFPISLPPCEFIIWITPKEAFLEGIQTGQRQRRTVNGRPVNGYPKTSTGFNGRGHWLVERP